MKRLFTLLTVLLCTTLSAFAQGDSPYARFGYEGKVLRTPQERQQRMMLVVPNPDTTAAVAAVGLDPAKQKYYLFDKQNQIIASDTLAGTTVSKFLSVDPLTKDYPELTPYQFASNTPVWAIDLDGKEAYFTNDGAFSRWGSDRSPKAPVILLNNDKEIATGLNVKTFQNRVYWVAGEGAGSKTALYYAYAIKNAKSYGFHGEGFSEENLYKNLWKDNTYKSKDFLAGLPNEKGKNTYQSYKSAFPKKDDFSKWDNTILIISQAILSAQAGTAEDPTRGATNWGGGIRNYNFYKIQFGAKNVISINDQKGIHNFFNLNTGTLAPPNANGSSPASGTSPTPSGQKSTTTEKSNGN